MTARPAFATALVGLPWLPWPMINAVFGSNSGLLLQEREDGCSFHIFQTVNRVSVGWVHVRYVRTSWFWHDEALRPSWQLQDQKGEPRQIRNDPFQDLQGKLRPKSRYGWLWPPDRNLQTETLSRKEILSNLLDPVEAAERPWLQRSMWA